MKTEKIYKLADEMTDEQVEKTVDNWILKNETDKVKQFETLVKLGDSKQLACATILLTNPISKETLESYRFAYEN